MSLQDKVPTESDSGRSLLGESPVFPKRILSAKAPLPETCKSCRLEAYQVQPVHNHSYRPADMSAPIETTNFEAEQHMPMVLPHSAVASKHQVVVNCMHVF